MAPRTISKEKAPQKKKKKLNVVKKKVPMDTKKFTAEKRKKKVCTDDVALGKSMKKATAKKVDKKKPSLKSTASTEKSAKATPEGKGITVNKPQSDLALDVTDQAAFEKYVSTLDSDDLTPGTLYLGHIPHGFYEKEVRGYFEQFGTVKRVRLARSKKTGGHKGYGFIQFSSDEVARIASEAMDGYLMFDKILQCKLVAEADLHRNVWKGANKRFVPLNRAARDRKLQNRIRTTEQTKKVVRKLRGNDNRRRRKLKELGIDYEFDSFDDSLKKPVGCTEDATANSGE